MFLDFFDFHLSFNSLILGLLKAIIILSLNLFAILKAIKIIHFNLCINSLLVLCIIYFVYKTNIAKIMKGDI
ncbi:hypothetical protein AF74_07610 [Aliarcobacter butzleri L349]|nr:hypothetical protein AF74_07610 [Aliarcobacter butzleri L349]RZV16772.1 hypothetical protein D3M75_09325 [Aliarcobacter butzleri]